ncbi:MAG: type VI secretion system membrane subunit TssM [Pseudomonadota bacterium]
MNPLSIYSSIRSWVDSYAGVIGRRFISLIWVIALAVVIWLYGGELVLGGVQPLGPTLNRLIAIGVIVLIWLIWTLVSWRRAHRAESAMIDDLADSPELRAKAETQEELAELRKRLRHAMKLLRRVVGKRSGYAYEFPWYLLMGVPGAGKTTLLHNSGLKFPLGDAMSPEPVRGVGGTRNCDWWFTDRAVLIDTAGRYTTQETNAQRDKAGWLHFLGLLGRHRPSQPVNGVLVVLSLTDLTAQDPEDRLRETRSIRQRLAEIEEAVKLRVPVYLILTKADRLPGFTQFFDGMGQQQRDQVWGMTFEYERSRDAQALPKLFAREYAALQDRLNGLLLERLQQEPDVERRGHIFRFPAQIAALEEVLREVVEELTSGSAHVRAPMVRGVYFASATQEAAIVQKPGARVMQRSYFIGRLFSDVILGEAALVTRDRRASRRRRVVRGLAYGTVSAAAVAVVVGWTLSFTFNRSAIARTEESLARYTTLAESIPVRDVRDADFLSVLPAIEALARAPRAFNESDAPEWATLLKLAGIGFDQREKIESNHSASYRDALGALMLPRMMVHLAEEMRREDAAPDHVFDSLKHYLALAGVGPISVDEIEGYFAESFDALYPGSGREGTRLALRAHVEALLESPRLPTLAIDDALVEETREQIAERGPAERALDLLKASAEARALSPWRPSAALGPVGAQIFARRSGTGLDDGIEGLFTRIGYRQVVIPRLAEVAAAAAAEDWVRGPAREVGATATAVARDAMQLYATEFVEIWRTVLSDLAPRPVASLQRATDLAALLASEARPLQRLAASVAEASRLAAPTATAGSGEDVVAGLASSDGLTAAIDDVIADAALPIDPMAVPDPYASLRRALEPIEGDGIDPSRPSLTALPPLFDTLYEQLNRTTISGGDAAEVFAADSPLTEAIAALRTVGQRLPDPADAWTVALADEFSGIALERARSIASALWAADGARACRRAIVGRYPFDRSSGADVTLNDFARLFGPGGIFEQFFETHLEPFVDVSVSPWRWNGAGEAAGNPDGALAQFQRAARIRDAFFPAGSTSPTVALNFTLQALDPDATVAIARIDGDQSVHRPDRSIERTLRWPGPESVTRSEIRLLPNENRSFLVAQGTWSPFRIFDAGEVAAVSDNQFDVRYEIDGRFATFRVTTSSVNNPFQLDAMAEFACPGEL